MGECRLTAHAAVECTTRCLGDKGMGRCRLTANVALSAQLGTYIDSRTEGWENADSLLKQHPGAFL
jgi:hypothetical protein